MKKKKKKKKAFRGGNYNFNGKSVKKRTGPKKVTGGNGSAAPSENGDGGQEHLEEMMELEGAEVDDGEAEGPGMLSYLGIQRKDSSDLGDSPESVNGVQKAKKTFAKPSVISR